ncbi:acyl-CoA N-acyltransferase [Cryomyces antarcticus]
MGTIAPLLRSPDHPPTKPSTTPNVLNVVLGNLLIKPWYPSFYPEELVDRQTERLYVCQACFRYSKELMPFLAHVKVCPLKDSAPQGNLIYAKDAYSVVELDGEQHRLYTQNLSLFGKLFLDTKSVFYDVTTFLYYLLIQSNASTQTRQVVGFFSKEKMSWDNNNLACILVFPPWQRRGLGQLLMGISYELSRREGRLGGPEKPLSEPGRLAYLSFWSAALARHILSRHSHPSQHAKKPLTVRALSEATWILPDDIIAALKAMGVVEARRKADGRPDEGVVISRARVRAWAAANEVGMAGPVDRKALAGRDGEGEGLEV